MEYLNDRLVMVAGIAGTRELIDRFTKGIITYPRNSIESLLARLDQQEAELADYDAQQVNHAADGSQSA
jgi:hypothetical protein